VASRPPRLRLDGRTWLLALTGAGVSAESGIPTFRAAGGLWESHPLEKVASPEGFAADPALVWRFYSERRRTAQTREPNPGHRALVAAEEGLGDRFLLATQNVDGLHARAGSRRLVELHGNLFLSRCARCRRAPFRDERTYDEGLLPRCEVCGTGLLRPHIVWFGEWLDPADLQRIEAFLREGSAGRLVFLAVGTSGVVYPAAGLVSSARRSGAETWLVNAEPPENVHLFDHVVEGKSGEILPGLWSWE
jgi:NAD-dependent deacetylase